MKSPVKFIITLLAIGVMASMPTLRAQDDKAPPAEGQKGGRRGGGRGPSVEQQVTRMDEALTLTADQKTKITAILTKAQEDIQALPQDQRREKGMEIRQTAMKDVRALLTPEQQTKFDAMPQQGPGGRRGGGGAGKKKDQ